MEQFDKMIKEMAEKEEMTVPNGFDERVQAALDKLPPKQKKHKPGAVKVALIAAAACLLLAGTALAASPELREMIWGSFAPYVQDFEENDNTVAVYDGVEVKLASAMTDGHMAAICFQIRDLEGKAFMADREALESCLKERYFIRFDPLIQGVGVETEMSYGIPEIVSYDGDTRTAQITYRIYNCSASGTSGFRLTLDTGLFGTEEIGGETGWEFIAELEALPVKVFELSGVEIQEFGWNKGKGGIESLEISAIGISVVPVKSDVASEQCYYMYLEAALADGTIVVLDPAGGGRSNAVQTWSFYETVDLDQVVGIYLDGAYIALDGSGRVTARSDDWFPPLQVWTHVEVMEN